MSCTGWFTPPPGPGAQPTVSSTAQPQDSGGAMHAAHATGNGSGQFDHSSRVMSDAAPGLDYAEAGPSFRGVHCLSFALFFILAIPFSFLLIAE